MLNSPWRPGVEALDLTVQLSEHFAYRHSPLDKALLRSACFPRHASLTEVDLPAPNPKVNLGQRQLVVKPLEVGHEAAKSLQWKSSSQLGRDLKRNQVLKGIEP
jgi:hypothetical protein